MELPSPRFLTITKFPPKYPVGRNHPKILGINFRCLLPIISSKKSSYQDFSEYAKPRRLVASRGLERDASSVEKGASLYRVRLQTSNAYGSGLSDVNSGVLLCLIDENGFSILQRLPATSVDETLRFERGSIDEFAFEGPPLGRIVAVWISLESGEWRISGINLRVIGCLGEKNQEMKGLQYDFELEDTLLGEKGEASMMEFRPHSVTAFSGENPSPITYPASNEHSMKEYEYLKLSLLFYDVVLILAGSAVASISTGENAAYAFLIGGLLGFAYLFLVQRSVDQLPAADLIWSENEGSGSRIFKSLKLSVWILVLVFALVLIMVKYVSGEDGVRLAPRDLIFGMMGFLMCKVALVLAAFKPITYSSSENE